MAVRERETGSAIFVAIGIVVCIFTGLIAFRFGQQHPSTSTATSGNEDVVAPQKITLAPTNFAKQLKLDNAKLEATLLPQTSVSITLPDEEDLPGGTVLEAWLVDLPRGVAGSSVSGNDEVFGTSFDNAVYDASLDAAPFAKSLGVLCTEGKTFTLPATTTSGTRPYDILMITLESDRNLGGYDPRPGTPIYQGNL